MPNQFLRCSQIGNWDINMIASCSGWSSVSCRSFTTLSFVFLQVVLVAPWHPTGRSDLRPHPHSSGQKVNPKEQQDSLHDVVGESEPKEHTIYSRLSPMSPLASTGDSTCCRACHAV